MSAAEREAERRWPGIGRGAERAALDRAMRGGFEAGAEWQAERDAVRIAELEAEVERQTAYAKNATDQQRHLLRQHREARARAEAAEAKLAAARALHQPLDAINIDAPPGRQRTRVCAVCAGRNGPWAVWPCATIQAIEGDNR